jgi:transposase
VRTYKRKHLRNPDRRMAAAVRLRAQGMSLRQIASELAVSYMTVSRDLSRWEAERPNVVPLSHLPVTNSPRRGQEVTPECDSESNNVIQLKR